MRPMEVTVENGLETTIREALGLDGALCIGCDGDALYATCPCGVRPTLSKATPRRCHRCRRVWRK
jgi:hypothetical protein